MIKTGLWLELEAAIGFIVGLGLGSLLGQRTVAVILMIVLEVILTPIAIRTQIPHFINVQRGIVGVATAHLEPGQLPLAFGGGGHDYRRHRIHHHRRLRHPRLAHRMDRPRRLANDDQRRLNAQEAAGSRPTADNAEMPWLDTPTPTVRIRRRVHHPALPPRHRSHANPEPGHATADWVRSRSLASGTPRRACSTLVRPSTSRRVSWGTLVLIGASLRRFVPVASKVQTPRLLQFVGMAPTCCRSPNTSRTTHCSAILPFSTMNQS